MRETIIAKVKNRDKIINDIVDQSDLEKEVSQNEGVEEIYFEQEHGDVKLIRI